MAELTESMPAEVALARIVAVCANAFDQRLAQMMTSDDPEGPHRARVALRRLRSALDGFAPLIDGKARKAVETEARQLFRLIGKVRDADVLLHHLSDADDRPDRQAAADRRRSEIREALRQAGAGSFRDRTMQRTREDGWFRTGARGRGWRLAPVRKIARRALDRAWEDCTAHGRRLQKMSVADRHDLRKDLKTLRYLGEFFGPLWPGAEQERFLDRMRALQDALGALNDLSLLDTGGAKPDAARAGALLKAAQAEWRALRKTDRWRG